MTEFPRPLVPVTGPYLPAKIDGAAAGMGAYGDATRALVDGGWLQPDMITGMTLALLARQPRKPRPDALGEPHERKASGVAGRVWVREQFTIHRPIARDDVWRVEGESTGTYVKKGRSYSTTAARSHNSAGERFATNLTTGLFSYTPQPDLADSVQGLPLEETPAPEPDWSAAKKNPHREAIASVPHGRVFSCEPVMMTLKMMADRDTDNPDNPIHSDPEQAKRAGLAKPIAGGSHVLSFALEAVMQGLGLESLLHGAHFDIRWKAPTEQDVEVVPRATVVEQRPDRLVLDLAVTSGAATTAMVGTLTIPIAPIAR